MVGPPTVRHCMVGKPPVWHCMVGPLPVWHCMVGPSPVWYCVVGPVSHGLHRNVATGVSGGQLRSSGVIRPLPVPNDSIILFGLNFFILVERFPVALRSIYQYNSVLSNIFSCSLPTRELQPSSVSHGRWIHFYRKWWSWQRVKMDNELTLNGRTHPTPQVMPFSCYGLDSLSDTLCILSPSRILIVNSIDGHLATRRFHHDFLILIFSDPHLLSSYLVHTDSYEQEWSRCRPFKFIFLLFSYRFLW
jgi:hypothetical protein